MVAFHQQIYDLDSTLSDELHKVPIANLTAIHHFPEYQAAFCLPPKSGCTNWLFALEPLAKDTDLNKVIYQRLPVLNETELESQRDKLKEATNFLNGRNPITRLFSGWKDKFRFTQVSKRERRTRNLFRRVRTLTTIDTSHINLIFVMTKIDFYLICPMRNM